MVVVSWRGSALAAAENNRPGRDKLREGLAALLDEYGGYKSFRTELGLSKHAVERFLEGEDDALTHDETRAVARYVGGVRPGHAKTNRLIRRVARDR